TAAPARWAAGPRADRPASRTASAPEGGPQMGSPRVGSRSWVAQLPSRQPTERDAVDGVAEHRYLEELPHRLQLQPGRGEHDHRRLEEHRPDDALPDRRLA